jgi:hypothetical protein
MAKRLAPTKNQSARPLTQKADGAGAMPLNFKVPSDFRREFKTYAAQHNKKLNQLLYEAFAALKAKND